MYKIKDLIVNFTCAQISFLRKTVENAYKVTNCFIEQILSARNCARRSLQWALGGGWSNVEEQIRGWKQYCAVQKTMRRSLGKRKSGNDSLMTQLWSDITWRIYAFGPRFCACEVQTHTNTKDFYFLTLNNLKQK